jgi:uncharacterized protein YktA (UPF0223 family)
MARRIQPIFDRIFAAFEANDPRIGGSQDFVKSLQEGYKRKKSLTRRQKEALLRIGAALDAPMPTVDTAMETRLTTLSSRAGLAGDKWTRDFAASLLQDVCRGKSLSARQMEVLVKVEARYTDEAMAALENWEQNFTPEMREKMQIVARYYRAVSQFYRVLVDKVLSDSDFVPSMRQWKKLVENKYAQKVLESHFSEPKYNVGQLVAYRSSAKRIADGKLLSVWGQKCLAKGFIIAAGAHPVVSAAKDCKVYTVLFIGDAAPTFVEERFLKKAKA